MNLIDTFNAAKDAFNNRKWPTLEGILDDYVVLKLLKPTAAAVSGKPAVMAALIADATLDNPTFTPHQPIIPHHQDQTFGFVTGTAQWVDTNGSGTIHYDFVFLNVGGTNPPTWRLRSLWGSKD